MNSGKLDAAVEELLAQLANSFQLDRSVGPRSLGEHLEEIIRDAAAAQAIEFGSPGDVSLLRRSTEGVMNFFYRPHLFPGMDPTLHLGHLVQYELLPRELPGDAPIEAAAMLESYCHLSGDLFGWLSSGDGEITVWVLDVSGHGVRAGFAAVVIKVILGDTEPGLPLTELKREVESRFIELRNPDDPGTLYATGVFLRISSGGSVEYLSAGHPPLLVKRRGGGVDQFEATSVPLVLFPGLPSASSRFELGPDDALFVCTDGLLELQNDDGEIFGIEHTVAGVEASDGSPCGILSSLTGAVQSFHELERLDDDLTFVALRLAPLSRLRTPRQDQRDSSTENDHGVVDSD